MKFFLSAIYLFLLEMYYQHYVIFEALHVICKQLKIIYYPKLYKSTNVWMLISFIKYDVFRYTCTHLHLSLSHTLCDFWYPFPHLKKKKEEDQVRSGDHNWPLPGQTQRTAVLRRVVVLSLIALESLQRGHCSQVATSSHFPTPSPFHSFTLPEETLEAPVFALLCSE